jgi:hypothetical protein
VIEPGGRGVFDAAARLALHEAHGGGRRLFQRGLGSATLE